MQADFVSFNVSWLIELRFYVDAKLVISETFFPANLSARSAEETKNLAQQKQTTQEQSSLS